MGFIGVRWKKSVGRYRLKTCLMIIILSIYTCIVSLAICVCIVWETRGDMEGARCQHSWCEVLITSFYDLVWRWKAFTSGWQFSMKLCISHVYDALARVIMGCCWRCKVLTLITETENKNRRYNKPAMGI